MKHHLPLAAMAALFIISCAVSSPIPGMNEALEQAASLAHPAASCTFCADVYGKNDVKHLCAASKMAWDSMVMCICSDPLGCMSECGADWCSRLGDVSYTNASDTCMSCVRDYCWPEVLPCSVAQ